MSLTKDGSTLRERLNGAQPNTLVDKLALLMLGNVLISLITHIFSKAPVAGAIANYQLTTVHVVVLPDFAKAASILRCVVKAGGVTGEFTPQAYGATPATTQCAVAPNGDIVLAAADAVTEVDLVYVPLKSDVYEVTMACSATSVLTLPTKYGKVIQLLEAEVTKGSTLGAKTILVPGAAPATTKANLNVAKTQVLFNVATDAVTEARVKFAVAPAVDLQAKLTATSDIG